MTVTVVPVETAAAGMTVVPVTRATPRPAVTPGMLIAAGAPRTRGAVRPADRPGGARNDGANQAAGRAAAPPDGAGRTTTVLPVTAAGVTAAIAERPGMPIVVVPVTTTDAEADYWSGLADNIKDRMEDEKIGRSKA